MSARLIRILLVEDSPGDVLLTREALREARVANELEVAPDGESALARLRDGTLVRPDIVLLDLNLPGMGGRAVLAAVKGDPDLRRIPVIVLTTSSADEDILDAYDRHVNSYIRKPVDLAKFIEVIRSIEDYWIGFVALPPN